METSWYPATLRRLRAGAQIRELTASVRLSEKQFIQPVFVEDGLRKPRAIEGLQGIAVQTTGSLPGYIEEALQQGISSFLFFPVPASDRNATFDFSFASATLQGLKKRFGTDVWIAADCCLCSYTDHGHCGILNETGTALLNNASVEKLSHYATLLAQAGADCIAPSDMMDGRIAAIRTRLDALGMDMVSIMSYAAKFSSQFYGPFRDACHSVPRSPALQNRKTYQISPFHPEDALAAAARDAAEGADILMVKPASLYTDIISRLKQQTLKPVAAYHVSGEYAAIETLAAQGLLRRDQAHLEVWAALTRSGAQLIISYAATEAAGWIKKLEY